MAKYIDRNAFLEHMKKTNRYFDVKHDIENFPAADVAPVVHGRWVYHNFGTICSECRKSAIFDEREQQAETEFCPHCGAKMGEEVNDT